MANPYSGKPDHQFWRRSVSGRAAIEVDPVVHDGPRITLEDRIATAGSCFAQHIARKLAASGYAYHVTEPAPLHAFSGEEQFGLFSARYGNIYTVRQLAQLFERAYAVFEPKDVAWKRADGRFIDPFRPNIKEAGFASMHEVVLERDSHLAAVRDMFETCDVFVFTLGLTEAWRNRGDGAVFPIAPGVVAEFRNPERFEFHNFDVAEMQADLSRFVDALRGVNPAVRIILTVSPVALAATYVPRHVLVSTTYSKAVLRVVAEDACRIDGVSYFPSFEMITGPHARGAFWADDLREVRPEGVAYVMDAFERHFLGGTQAPGSRPPEQGASNEAIRQAIGRITSEGDIICDEDLIERRA